MGREARAARLTGSTCARTQRRHGGALLVWCPDLARPRRLLRGLPTEVADAASRRVAVGGVRPPRTRRRRWRGSTRVTVVRRPRDRRRAAHLRREDSLVDAANYRERGSTRMSRGVARHDARRRRRTTRRLAPLRTPPRADVAGLASAPTSSTSTSRRRAARSSRGTCAEREPLAARCSRRAAMAVRCYGASSSTPRCA